MAAEGARQRRADQPTPADDDYRRAAQAAGDSNMRAISARASRQAWLARLRPSRAFLHTMQVQAQIQLQEQHERIGQLESALLKHAIDRVRISIILAWVSLICFMGAPVSAVVGLIMHSGLAYALIAVSLGSGAGAAVGSIRTRAFAERAALLARSRSSDNP